MAKVQKAAQPKGAKTKAKINKAKLDSKNEAVALKKVTEGKGMKYIYPSDVVKPLERKAFRQKVRATLNSFAKRIEKFEGKVKDRKALEKKSKDYSATVMA